MPRILVPSLRAMIWKGVGRGPVFFVEFATGLVPFPETIVLGAIPSSDWRVPGWFVASVFSFRPVPFGVVESLVRVGFAPRVLSATLRVAVVEFLVGVVLAFVLVVDDGLVSTFLVVSVLVLATVVARHLVAVAVVRVVVVLVDKRLFVEHSLEALVAICVASVAIAVRRFGGLSVVLVPQQHTCPECVSWRFVGVVPGIVPSVLVPVGVGFARFLVLV